MRIHFVRMAALLIVILTAGCSAIAPLTPDPGWITFTNRDHYYRIQLPPDWKYEQTSGSHYYLETFRSPDGQAGIQNLVYDDGSPIAGSERADFALGLLNQSFRRAAQPDDIVISDTSLMDDGSERLNWTSAAGQDTGISFLEVRGQTTLLVFTVEWANAHRAQYFDLLGRVVATYSVP